MLFSLPSIAALLLLQGPPHIQAPLSAECPVLKTIELASAPEGTTLEICVSPGLMTGFLFDAPADVELQDEPRFIQVLRGRSGVSVVPPREMVPGERLRFTVRLGVGSSQQLVPFSLVAHPGQATRQVEVYRDERPRESLELEVAQQRAMNQQLVEENTQLRIQLEHQRELRGLIASGKVGLDGVQVQSFLSNFHWQSDGGLELQRGATYRADLSVAVQVWVINSSPEAWMAAGASLVDAEGQSVHGVKLFQPAALLASKVGVVVVETETMRFREPLTLKLWGGPRAITVPDIRFPSSMR